MLIDISSLMKSQAHNGPNTASLNIKIPTTAEAVDFDPIVISINPKPTWKTPAIEAKKRSLDDIVISSTITKPTATVIIAAINCAGTISTLGFFLIMITKIAKEIGIKNAIIFPMNSSSDWIDRELPSINKTPNKPIKIEIKVIVLIYSFKKI